eukprot:9146787-Lingulodinium_polyedra.AAC.1
MFRNAVHCCCPAHFAKHTPHVNHHMVVGAWSARAFCEMHGTDRWLTCCLGAAWVLGVAWVLLECCSGAVWMLECAALCADFGAAKMLLGVLLGRNF